jgi:phosphohistidine phosphatase
MTELYLLRHADAGDPERWAGDDAERPLSGKGLRQAGRLAAHLRALGWTPDAVVTSPKRRAAETAEIVAGALGVTARLDGRLGAAFGLAELGELLAAESAAKRLLLVGHDPDFSDLASMLVGAAVQLRKGSLIRIDLDDAAETGVIRWLLPPDVLPEG